MSCSIFYHGYFSYWCIDERLPSPPSCQAARFPTFCILSALGFLQRCPMNSGSPVLTIFLVGRERRRFADVSAPSALILLQQTGRSTQLPTWQRDTFTCKDFYYFYFILLQPQPWNGASPTLKDAPTKNAAVSWPACRSEQLEDFQAASLHLSRWCSHKRRLYLRTSAKIDICDLGEHPLPSVPSLRKSRRLETLNVFIDVNTCAGGPRFAQPGSGCGLRCRRRAGANANASG